MIPDDLRYTAEHEWARATGPSTVRIGITDYAQNQLGDVVFVELPEVGSRVSVDSGFGEVESTKSTSELIAPVSGEVLAVNDELAERPEQVNAEPYGSGWLLDVRTDGPADSALAGLLDPAGYAAAIT